MRLFDRQIWSGLSMSETLEQRSQQDLEQPILLCYVEGDWSLRSFSPAVGVRLHDEKMLKAERSGRNGSAEEDALCSSVQIFLTCEFGE